MPSAKARKYGEGPLDFHESLRRTVEPGGKGAGPRRAHFRPGHSGFTDIDYLLGGLQPSDLIILAGRPGMGKTSLATNMAFHAARAYVQDIAAGAEVPRGAPVLFFSLEMAAQQLSARILSEQTEIEMWKIRNGRFSESEWEKFVLIDAGAFHPAALYRRHRRHLHRPDRGPRPPHEARKEYRLHHHRLSAAGRAVAAARKTGCRKSPRSPRALKVLAKELNVPVIALSQLSRGVDSRDDKRPVLSDLRESGSIEQDADVVMFVYREEYYLKSREPDPSSADHAKWLEKCERAHRRAEVLVEKHRHGATNKIDLYFDDRFTRFSNLVAGKLAADAHELARPVARSASCPGSNFRS